MGGARCDGTIPSGAAVFLAAAIAWSLARRALHTEPAWSSFTQLTDASGVETSPSLSPDAQYFAYSSNARGTVDIYVQRVGGRTPVVVAGDSTVDEAWPAYSPDGRQIAYAVEGGGIFVVGATGESPRRLTSFGSNPAWSPDGQHIVFGSEEAQSAYNVNANGTLWIVDVAGGEPRHVGQNKLLSVYQPAWSPSGERIAFFAVTGGQRDIETIRVDGTDRVRVTDDRDVDWAPAWSADGKSLYFASDRGGTMGLWRIAVDESSGHATGAPVPIASGADVAMDLPHPSHDGTTLLFRSKIESINPAAMSFDPVAARIGDVKLLQNRTGTLTPTDVSPDGKWLALFNSLDRQQDIFVMHPDGTGLTRLTDDPARDWEPRFTPDGSALTFYTNASGKYNGWSIRLDGSGRTQLSDITPGAVFPMFAPDGKRLMLAVLPRWATIVTPPWPVTNARMKRLEGLRLADGDFSPTFWSRTGRWISGYVLNDAGETKGFAVLEVATGKVQRLNDDSRSYDMAWLPGDREVVYYTNEGKLVLQDVLTHARREIAGTLPYPPAPSRGVIVSRDGRTLYYGAYQLQSNIWLVRRAAAAAP